LREGGRRNSFAGVDTVYLVCERLREGCEGLCYEYYREDLTSRNGQVSVLVSVLYFSVQRKWFYWVRFIYFSLMKNIRKVLMKNIKKEMWNEDEDEGEMPMEWSLEVLKGETNTVGDHGMALRHHHCCRFHHTLLSFIYNYFSHFF